MSPIDILLVSSGASESGDLHEALNSEELIEILNCAEDGEQALAYLRREGEYAQARRPGLVLLDIDLDADVKHGFEVLNEIKEDPELRAIPVVVLTNSHREADVLQVYAAGACSFISKPIGLTRLKELAAYFAQYWALVAELPFNRTLASANNAQSHSVMTMAQLVKPPKSVEPINILVVDDNDDDAVLLEEAFSDSHVLNLVHVASRDGVEAMSYLRREGKFADAARPGLVLLDINMPRKHGFEVLCEVKEDESLRDIPIVMMTSSKRESDILQAYSGGACSFISKPVDFEKMRRVADHFAMYWTLVVDIPKSE